MFVPEFHPKHIILIQQSLLLGAIFGLVPEQRDHPDPFSKRQDRVVRRGDGCVCSSTAIFSGGKDLLVRVVLNINKVVGHGLVGELVEDGAHRVETSFHNQQLGLSLLLPTDVLF